MVKMMRVEKIDAGYGRIPILHQVSLSISANECVAIIGANGAGKSTLVRAICGLLPLSVGKIYLGEKCVTNIAPHDRVTHGIGVVLENRHLFGELTVRANLDLARIKGNQRNVQRPLP